MSAVSDVLTSLGGASALALGASKVWSWWERRDAAKLAAEANAAKAKADTEATKLAAEADAARAKTAADADATTRLLAAYEEQAKQAEKRATDAAEGRAAVARALTDVAHASMEQARAIDDHTAASRESREHMADVIGDVKASLARLEAQHGEILAALRGRPS